MHREFHKYLRPDGLGLDYSYLEDFDTHAELELYNSPLWKRMQWNKPGNEPPGGEQH